MLGTLCGRGAIRALSNRNAVRFASRMPAYPGHIPLNWFENAFLAVGSGLMALADPRRGGTRLTTVRTQV